MIGIAKRIELMTKLGKYLSTDSEDLKEAIALAHRNNAWFTPEFVSLSLNNICKYLLEENDLIAWVAHYPKIAQDQVKPITVGIVMAGNIPLVGFHDFLCGFISGHKLNLKLSSKDTVLWQHILAKLLELEPAVSEHVEVAEMLKDCDAYIATGSNNSSRYFEYYFQKYPNIIRKNRSSVALLDGKETEAELAHLSDDICQYFGFGCRNVTQIFVPNDYKFEPLLSALNKYISHIDHNKFKNNYDYQLALFLLNKQYYMSNGHILLVASDSIYAPISVVNYQTYEDQKSLLDALHEDERVQCISLREPELISNKIVRFGQNQRPSLMDYADGVDTMAFLQDLN
jgi:hypothetical protein